MILLTRILQIQHTAQLLYPTNTIDQQHCFKVQSKFEVPCQPIKENKVDVNLFNHNSKPVLPHIYSSSLSITIFLLLRLLFDTAGPTSSSESANSSCN